MIYSLVNNLQEQIAGNQSQCFEGVFFQTLSYVSIYHIKMNVCMLLHIVRYSSNMQLSFTSVFLHAFLLFLLIPEIIMSK